MPNKDPKKQRETHLKFHARHPEKKAEYKRRARESGAASWWQRKCRYGITKADFAALLDSQGGVCGVCGEPFGKRTMVIDHDHKDDRVRGILHIECNAMLGCGADSPERLEAGARYLRADAVRREK